MKVLKRPVLVYTLEVTEQEIGALERACEARLREMQGFSDDDLSGTVPALMLATIRSARVREGE